MQDSVKQDRDKFIGGSDLPAIMNLSPFKKRFDLLLEKAGYKEDEFTGNIYTEYGNALEPVIRDWVNASLPKTEKFKEGKHTREAKDDEPIGVRIHTDGENDTTVLEIKTTSQVHEDVNDYKIYLVQLLYYMVLTGKDYGVLAVYERPEDISAEDISPETKPEFNSDRLQVFNIAITEYEDLVKEIGEAVEHFVEDLKQVKANPFITEEELLPQEIPDITARIIAFESQLEYLKQVEKTVKAEKDKLKKAMQSCGIKSFKTPNGYRLTLVDDGEDSIKKVFDETALKKALPDIYALYLKDKVVKGKAGYVLITPPKKEQEDISKTVKELFDDEEG